MLAEYTGIAAMVVVGFGLAGGLLLANRFFAPSRAADAECDSASDEDNAERDGLAVPLYLAATVILVFAVAGLFVYPWAALFRELGVRGFFEMLPFVAVLAIGLTYAWMKGAFEW